MPIRRWTDSLNKGDCNELYRELSLLLLSRVSDKDAREYLTTCISSDRILDLCNYDPDYGQLTAYDALNIRQVLAFYQKRRDIDVGIDRRRAAESRFIEAEALCKETNALFRMRAAGKFNFPRGVEHVLFHARRKIAEILGDVPSLSDLKLRFSNGALATLPKKKADVIEKLYHTLSCSEGLVPILGSLLEEVPHLVFTPDEIRDEDMERKTVQVQIVDARLDFVPKNFKTDRAIAVEPMLNSLIQLGIGDYMADRLRKFGFDTRDQTRNQRLAREGSITGELATLDLSSASDTVSSMLVLDLLPYDWYDLLDIARSPSLEYQGFRFSLEKFSSMGNGFTFPLETLIFASLALASCKVAGCEDRRVSVYGDDIIIPVEAYDLLTQVLRCVGFIPNKEKSYASGKFRESCGHDYLSGINIRPCYVKEGSFGPQLFVLHNFFKRNYDEEAASVVLRYILPEVRLFGPDGYGDGHLLGDWHPKPYRREFGYAGWTFETYRFRPRKRVHLLPGDYRFPLYSTYIGGDSAGSSIGVTTDREGRVVLSVASAAPKASSYDRIKIYTLTP